MENNMEKELLRMKLELEIIKQFLNWSEDLNPMYGNSPRITATIKDDGARGVLTLAGDYEDIHYFLSPEEVQILIDGE